MRPLAHPDAGGGPGTLADVLERVLDKGVVIVGDITVSVLDVELLSLKLRLFVSSAQTAREMGMDWWTRDPFFAPGLAGERAALAAENAELRSQLAALEAAPVPVPVPESAPESAP